MIFECSGLVSIWVGNLENAEELSALLEERDEESSAFWRMIGTDWIDHDFCESFFISGGEAAERFLGCFSYSASFADEAAFAAVAAGFVRHNAAILIYDFDYRINASPLRGSLAFIGSFSYEKSALAKYPPP